MSMLRSVYKHHRFHHITEIYLTQVLYGFGVALTGVFIPIYLITLGYSLKQVILFLIIEKACVCLLSPFVASISARLGLKRTTLLRIPFSIGSFLLLFALSYTNLHYSVVAIVASIATVLYFIPIHAIFIRYSHNKSRSKEVGILQGIPAFFQILAPSIGGIVAAIFGFPILILIALTIVTLSTIPLFVTKDIQPKNSFSFRDLWATRKHPFSPFIIADGFTNVAAGIQFPLLIFFSLQTVQSVGFIKTVGVLVFALATLAIGKFSNRTKVNLLSLGAVFWGVSVFIRPIFTTAEGFVAVIIFGALTFSLFNTKYLAAFYNAASKLKDRKDEFVVIREMYLNAARVLLLAILLVVPFSYGFFIAGAASIMTGIFASHRL